MKKHFIVALGVAVLLPLALFCFLASKNPLMWQTLPFMHSEEAKKVEKLENLIWKSVPGGAPWENRDSHTVYEWKGKLYLLGGLDANNSMVNGTPVYEKAVYFNDVWSTEDGAHWKLETEHAEFPPIRSTSVAEINDALYMVGGWSPEVGYKNGIWKSTDAVHWQKVADEGPLPAREGQQIIKFKDKWLLIGGVDYFGRKTFNDIWSTTDGTHWELLLADAPWHSRWDFYAQVFQGKLWLVGGMNFHGVGYDDVWTSVDGKNWVYISKAPMGARQGQEIVNYRGGMVIVGGLDSATNEGYNKTYYTVDGQTWQKSIFHNLWVDREDHSVVVFKDKIWIYGGMDANWHWNNDIWYTDFAQ